MRVEAESGTILIDTIKTGAFLKFFPGAARNRQERTGGVYALDEVVVTTVVIAA